MTAPAGGELERRRLRVNGVVQGVGFRPHVHRVAASLGLGGFVANDAEGVLVEVEGPPADVEAFAARLVAEAPPLAVVAGVAATCVPPLGEAGFRIVTSRSGARLATLVPPDVAVCAECLAELFDPTDRRYRYPFVNCTSCGPRFTIITSLPYDRERTTMRSFPLCSDCAGEYGDPSDRRFHAEPVACPACGPQLTLECPGTAPCGGEAALEAAVVAIGEGRIVAVKGVGGFHLACDAASQGALGELRRRKGRAEKPFALMVRDLAAARRLAAVGDAEAELLTSPARPIVLLERRRGSPLSELVAPGNPRIGLMLPYSPLHHLLLAPIPGSSAPVPEALVMTSGNLSDEPIAYEDGDARRRLASLADCLLLHDRPIARPCDDSVMLVSAAGDPLPVRRSRGYAPLPIELPLAVPPLFAAGGELKSTACVASGTRAFLTQHLGDMGSVETLQAFERLTGELGELYEVSPELVAADRHPGYHSRRAAEERAQRQGLPVVLVQHHHAHLAALLAEHGVLAGEQVLAFAFDGTGYGEDGEIWGGEVLAGGYGEVERLAHLREVPLPGGDAAIRKPYRVALSFLATSGISWHEDLAPVRAAPPGELAVLARQLERGTSCVPATSMGRLFDAVASIAGVRQLASYEAQAAIELEGAALEARSRILAATAGGSAAVPGGGGRGWRLAGDLGYRFAIGSPAGEDGARELDPSPVLSAVVEDVRAGRPTGEVALGFHHAVAELVGDVSASLCQQLGLGSVGLTGGVFQNVLLVELARAALARRGLGALVHRLVPPNDAGLALGQAVVAGYRAARLQRPSESAVPERQR